MPFIEPDARPLSHTVTASSTMPLQSSSTPLPGASNAPGLTSAGFEHSVESQQSPPHVVTPSPSASTSSSTLPLQLLSMPSVHSSCDGTTSSMHGPHVPVESHVRVPP